MKLPNKIEELSPALLTKIFQAKYPKVVIESITIPHRARCGDGIASTADRINLQLSYKVGCDEGLPKQIVLKTILLHPYLRFGLPIILGLAQFIKILKKIPFLGTQLSPLIFSLINVYQRYFPHAPAAMYANEVLFYSNIRPKLDIETPQCFGATFDKTSGQFAIFMEDLVLRNASFPNAAASLSLEHIKSLLENLAALHAQFWNSSDLEKIEWLPRTYEGGIFPVFNSIGLDIIKDQVKKNKFKQDLIAPLNKTIDELWSANWQAQKILYQREPLTFLHGDPHVGNTYLLANGQAGFLDFQLIVQGPWINDFCYLIVTGLDSASRKQHEKVLLEFYFECLRKNGVSDIPNLEQAWLSYRIATIWGLVIGWLITPPQNYGEAITSANIQRTTQAIIDLRGLEALNEL